MRWIVADPEHCGGKPRIVGTRISVAQLLQALASGLPIKEVVKTYPALSEEAIRGTLAEIAQSKQFTEPPAPA